MEKYGMLINYDYCTGCHSCELACRNEKGLGAGQWGIKLTEIGPFEMDKDHWEWDYIPVPTDYCDLCLQRIGRGEKPACAHHCLADVMEVGTVEQLTRKLSGNSKTVLFTR